MNTKVHVSRDVVRAEGKRRWLVHCDYCAGGDFLSAFRPLGYTRTWRQAQDYAQKHALEHEKTRCPTCLHVPAEKLIERTKR